MKPLLIALCLLLSSCASYDVPKERLTALKSVNPHWWAPIPQTEKKSWEISPDSVQPPKVIVSKRNELGVLSNFSATPFQYRGKKYASMEGFWQAMKFPTDQKDQRWKLAKWPHTSSDVAKLSAFKAKRAGDFGSKVMKKNKISWVQFENKKMTYRENKKGEFYKIIVAAMTEKLKQNENVQETLCLTEGLELLPDHSQGSNPPPAWQYHKIWMQLRRQYCKNGSIIF